MNLLRRLVRRHPLVTDAESLGVTIPVVPARVIPPDTTFQAERAAVIKVARQAVYRLYALQVDAEQKGFLSTR
jgi:hypothetical protein